MTQTQQQQQQQQEQPQLTPQVQQALSLVGLRLQDFVAATNNVVSLFVAENQQLKDQIVKLQAPIKTAYKE